MVPRFIAALEDGGAAVTRVDAYVTRAGVSAEDIAPEAALMSGGCVDAIVFTSTAEAQGLLVALGGVEDLQTLVLEQGAPPPALVALYAASYISVRVRRVVNVLEDMRACLSGLLKCVQGLSAAIRFGKCVPASNGVSGMPASETSSMWLP